MRFCFHALLRVVIAFLSPEVSSTTMWYNHLCKEAKQEVKLRLESVQPTFCVIYMVVKLNGIKNQRVE